MSSRKRKKQPPQQPKPVATVKHAIKHNIKIISSCGTGNRIKPDKLYISNIWKTEYDPLAKKLRYTLRKENIDYKLPVVCSKEIPLPAQISKSLNITEV